MDFKNYVRMILEADKAKDQDEERAEDEDENEDEEDSDDEEDEDDEEQASVKTKKEQAQTGAEPSVKTKCCSVCGKEPCVCGSKKKSLKESIIYSAKYSSNTLTENVLSEETRILVEGIKNNSASKYLSKLAKKAEKEAAKYEKKGWKDEAKTSKNAAKALKEASNKLYRAETRYQAGDVSAKKEYKQICKQYSSELKNLGKTARGLKGLLFTLVSGVILLGAVGTTVAANGELTDKISTAINNFKEGRTDMGLKTLGDIAENDKNFVKSVISGEKFAGTDWAGKKGDMEAQAAGWASAAERKHYTEEGLGGAVGKASKAVRDFGKGFADTYKGGAEVVEKSLKGAKEAAKK